VQKSYNTNTKHVLEYAKHAVLLLLQALIYLLAIYQCYSS